MRESEEEIGSWHLRVLMQPIFIGTSPGFEYWTFLAISLDGEFKPVLNWENDASVWVPRDVVLSGEFAGHWVHPGVVQAIARAP